MDENKVKEISEVMKEEYMPTEVTSSDNRLMVAVGIGIAALVGLSYKFVVKPFIAKHKAKEEPEEVKTTFKVVENESSKSDEQDEE